MCGSLEPEYHVKPMDINRTQVEQLSRPTYLGRVGNIISIVAGQMELSKNIHRADRGRITAAVDTTEPGVQGKGALSQVAVIMQHSNL